MKRTQVITGLLMLLSPVFAQTNFPVVGISDVRPGIYGLLNARVIASYDQDPVQEDILIVNGTIKAVGKGLDFPAGTIKIDLEGKTIYPSFVDIYTSYGVPSTGSGSSNSGPGYLTQSQRGPVAEKPRVADYWNQGIHENYRVTSEFIPDTAKAAKYRQAGFGAVVTFNRNGIARGTSALVSLGNDKANSLVLKDRASANYSFSRGASGDRYPTAQYGAIALLRQLYLDAQWYEQLPEGRFYDAALEALRENNSLPKVFEVNDKYEILRADAIGDEFGIRYIVKGSGNEYQLIDEIRKAGVSLIIPLKFPEAPDVKDPYVASGVDLSTLKHWEMAPANPALLSKAGIEFSLTSDGLSKPEEFLKGLRKAVEMGLDKRAALKASTYTPASMVGAENLVGAIKGGMVANLLVTSGDLFDEDCVIHENWVQGRPYIFVDPSLKSIAGDYKLMVGDREFGMKIQGRPDQPTLKVTSGEEEVKSTIRYKNDLVTIALNTSAGMISLSGAFYDGTLKGDGLLEDGQWSSWKTEPAPPPGEEEEAEQKEAKGEDDRSSDAMGQVTYPFVAYGWVEKPVPERILFKNGTIWTLDGQGKIEGSDVFIEDGKIVRVGKDLPSRGARVIDATGLHITPGIIDEHSHIAMASTNEVGQAITSEVRVGDVIDPADNNIYRQLSGGVTAAHLLHGSANPVGGQSVIIKHRWGSPADELKIDGQVGFLKHALGENVKRSTDRYPNSRMGAEHMIRDAYQRAVDYRAEWQRYDAMNSSGKAAVIPPRRELELEALVDVLEQRSFMTCHTYVQSEGMMIMKLAEDFGIKAHTLIHFNEAYKIADKMKAHGAAGSVFSDWWDYKYEVYEGITYNAATLVQEGVLTCLHSDNAEMSRRLNQEAGKIVKYGGIDPVEALKLVTLNPARILHLDHRMGSIEPGKDADLVLWSDHPLSVYARAKMTLVDGIVYFDEAQDAVMKVSIDEERNRIIQKILKEGGSSARSAGSNRRTY